MMGILLVLAKKNKETTIIQMSELSQGEDKTKSPEDLFYQLLEQMPANMTLYEELQDRRNDLWTMRKSYDSRIESIDINAALESHPPEVAYGALGLYVLDRKISALERQMQELDRAGDWIEFIDLHGRKVRVEPLGDVHKIATIAPGNNYIGGTKRAKAGTLTEIRLRPSEGGVIHFRTKLSGDSHRSAHPLFDHFKKEPQFNIELLD
jgi:hypothetical protein